MKSILFFKTLCKKSLLPVILPGIIVCALFTVLSGCSLGGVDAGLVGNWELTYFSGPGVHDIELEITSDDSYTWDTRFSDGRRYRKTGDLKGNVVDKTVEFDYKGDSVTYSYSIFFNELELSTPVYIYKFKKIY